MWKKASERESPAERALNDCSDSSHQEVVGLNGLWRERSKEGGGTSIKKWAEVVIDGMKKKRGWADEDGSRVVETGKESFLLEKGDVCFYSLLIQWRGFDSRRIRSLALLL